MFSEEAEFRLERQRALEQEREELAMQQGDTKKRVGVYRRGKVTPMVEGVKDKKLHSHLVRTEQWSEHTAKKAARVELLLQEEPGYLEAEGMERTHKFKQKDIAAAVPLANSLHFFNLKLDTFGPYSINYSRDGRHLLIGGKLGHVATMDWRTKSLGCEFHVRETVRDVQYLHNEMMFAVAQKRNLHIYDHTGMELHCLKQHTKVNRLQFLPYHFLLASADEYGTLRYLDTSTGTAVAEHRTRLGSLKCMAQNPCNAIIHLGHHNGTVTLWSPNQHSPLVKMLCHRGPITDLAIDWGGWYLATAGMDSRLKIWDVRTYKTLHLLPSRHPATCLDISQRGLLVLGRGREVQVWTDALKDRPKAPYLQHEVAGEVNCVRCCPFEDCVGIGHSSGFSSIIVPGAGEANFDALEANPFQGKRQRQEAEVKGLLEKIPADLITLDPDQISKVEPEKPKEREEAAGFEKRETKEKRKRGHGGVVGQLHKKQRKKEEAGKELRRRQLQDEADLKRGEEEEGKRKKIKTHVLDRFR